MEVPLISIVIPTCDRPENLARCLSLLMPQVNRIKGTEVLVSDDGAATVEQMLALHFPLVNWMRGPRKGVATNRNHGAHKAIGKWLIFLDDDVLPSETLLSSYLAAFASATPETNAFEGVTLNDRVNPSLLWEAPFNPDCKGHPSCNWAFRKSAFIATGSFDERYIRMQDIEFAARYEAAGGSFKPVPAALVIHPLRKLPSAAVLASRWKYKLLFTLDLGAPASWAGCFFLWHVFRVITSRFRGCSFSRENIYAGAIFAKEWIIVL